MPKPAEHGYCVRRTGLHGQMRENSPSDSHLASAPDCLPRIQSAPSIGPRCQLIAHMQAMVCRCVQRECQVAFVIGPRQLV